MLLQPHSFRLPGRSVECWRTTCKRLKGRVPDYFWHWQLVATRQWQLVQNFWQLAPDIWQQIPKRLQQMVTYFWQEDPTRKWQLVPKLWQLVPGSWQLVPGIWQLVRGYWQLDRDEWQLVAGRLRKLFAVDQWDLPAWARLSTLVWPGKSVWSAAEQQRHQNRRRPSWELWLWRRDHELRQH